MESGVNLMLFLLFQQRDYKGVLELSNVLNNIQISSMGISNPRVDLEKRTINAANSFGSNSISPWSDDTVRNMREAIRDLDLLTPTAELRGKWLERRSRFALFAARRSLAEQHYDDALQFATENVTFNEVHSLGSRPIKMLA